MNDKIKILLVDDQPIIRSGLRQVLEQEDQMQVIDEANNGREAYIKASLKQPDIILMDIRMPIMDGVEATKIIKKEFPKIKILVLTTFDDDQYIIKAISYGASGYLLKDIEIDKLKQAIHDALNDDIILPGQIAKKIIHHLPQMDHHLTQDDFTAREKDMILLLLEGKTNQEIADTLYLSLGTVKNYVSTIYSKLDVIDRANAIIQLKKIGF
ncbi:MAG: response regulator transcription factor [Acholeplasmataceae bacterium]|jgi:DNA-binding NarL/FixJ family response regulator|nr:response regulator transcription factor [Acholeplasmataceae bacterium]